MTKLKNLSSTKVMKIMNKDIRSIYRRRVFCLSTIIIFLVVAILFNTYFVSPAIALNSSDLQKIEDRANKRAYAQTLDRCIENMSDGNLDRITQKQLSKGEIFEYVDGKDLKNQPFDLVGKGRSIEEFIDGFVQSSYVASKLNADNKIEADHYVCCNEVSRHASTNLGINMRKEVFCSASKDNPKNLNQPGIFKVKKKHADKMGCDSAVTDSTVFTKYIELSKERNSFFRGKVLEKYPDMGKDLYKMDPIENYFYYKSAFFSTCVKENTVDFSDGAIGERIKYFNREEGSIADASFEYYSKKDAKSKVVLANGKKLTCGQLAKKLSGTDKKDTEPYKAWEKEINKMPEKEKKEYGETHTPHDAGDTESANTCYNTLGSKSWDVCANADALRSFGSEIYETVAQNFLNINPQLFQEGNKTAEAWAIFVRIANALFVVLLVVVIFSQLTGIGLDNYGIKKVLPKLIISAILINTSYFICQFAVDISNIVGSSLKSLLDNIATSIGGAYGDLAGGTKALIVLIAGVVGIGAGAVFASSFITSGWAAFLPVLLGLLSFATSVLFLLFLLSVRQALVLVLVVISPLAFACYILPNTKKLFDKWFKIFKTMLILYPITSLLMGGGALASSIILQGIEGKGQEDMDLASLFIAISGLIIRVAPVFFVPSVVKSSFAALGTVGAKFSGLGKQFGSKATSGIAGAAGYKRAQELSRRQATQFRAGVDKDGKEIKNVGRLRKFISGGKAGMKDSRMQYLKDLDAKSTEDQVLKEGFIEAGQIAREKRAEKAALDDEMININSQTQNGEDQDALFGLYDEAVQSGNSTRARAIVEVAGRRGDTAKALMDHHHDKVAKGEFNNMSAETEAGIMKQIATGDNSKNYRASDAVAFEYASAYNKNQIQPDSEGRRMSFDTWAGNEKNVHNAISYHAASATEFFGQKNGAIKRIISGNLREEDRERIKGYYNTVMSSNELRGSIDDEKLQTMKAFVEQGQSGATTGTNNPNTNSTPDSTPTPPTNTSGVGGEDQNPPAPSSNEGAEDHIRATYSSDTMEDGQTYKL